MSPGPLRWTERHVAGEWNVGDAGKWNLNGREWNAGEWNEWNVAGVAPASSMMTVALCVLFAVSNKHPRAKMHIQHGRRTNPCPVANFDGAPGLRMTYAKASRELQAYYSRKWSKFGYILAALKERVIERRVPGAILELGVFAGHTTRLLRMFIDQRSPDRELHAYDSFEGLPARDERDGKQLRVTDGAGGMAIHKAAFLEKFQAEGLRPPDGVHAGFFGAIPDREYPEPVAFAFFDGDLHSSIRDSFAQVYHKLSPGGVVLVHDYNDSASIFPGAKLAVSDFLASQPESRLVECHGIIAMVVKREVARVAKGEARHAQKLSSRHPSIPGSAFKAASAARNTTYLAVTKQHMLDAIEVQAPALYGLTRSQLFRAGDTLLDVGAGSGQMANYLRNKYRLCARAVDVMPPTQNVWAVDRTEINASRLAVETFDGKRLPAASASADVILLGSVLHHAANDTAALLQDVARVARRWVIVIEDLNLLGDEAVARRNFAHDKNGIFRTLDEWRGLLAALPGVHDVRQDMICQHLNQRTGPCGTHFFSGKPKAHVVPKAKYAALFALKMSPRFYSKAFANSACYT